MPDWRQCFLFLNLCLLLGVQAAIASETEESQKLTTYMKPFSRLQSIGTQLQQGQLQQIRAWIAEHKVEATALLREVMVDVYASSWIGLEPLHPHSKALFPVLARELGADKLLDPSCRWDDMHSDWWDNDVPEACNKLPGAEQLQILRYALGRNDGMKIQDFPRPDNILSMYAYAFIEKIDEPWTQRAQMQLAYFEGLDHNADSKRIAALERALALSQEWKSLHFQVLIHLAQSRVYERIYSHSMDGDHDLKLAPGAASERAKDYLLQARGMIAQLKDPYLTFLGLLAQGEHQRLLAMELHPEQMPSPQLMQLQLADSVYVHDSENKTHVKRARQIYADLLAKGSPSMKLRVIKRMLHMGQKQDLLDLRDRFSHEAEPEIRIMLLNVFPKLDQGRDLFRMLQSEKDLSLRREMAQILSNSYHHDQGDQYRDFRLLEPLLKDPDDRIRWRAAAAMFNIDEPKYQELVLSWLDQDDPNLLGHALSKASNLNRKDLLPKVLRFLKHPQDHLQSSAVYFVERFGSAKNIPDLEAALPSANGRTKTEILMAIARFKGPEAWLEALDSKIESSEYPLNLLEIYRHEIWRGYLNRAVLERHRVKAKPAVQEAIDNALAEFPANIDSALRKPVHEILPDYQHFDLIPRGEAGKPWDYQSLAKHTLELGGLVKENHPEPGLTTFMYVMNQVLVVVTLEGEQLNIQFPFDYSGVD